MFAEGEPVQAFCFLTKNKQPDNQAFLTDESLIFRRNGRVKKFERSTIQSILIRTRIYLIPVIAGGIMAPLATVALISHIGDLMIMMLLIGTGLFLLYYGLQGGDALSVITKVRENDIFLPEITPEIRSYVRYVQWQLKSTDDLIYLIVTEEQWKNLDREAEVPAGTRIFLHRGELPSGHVGKVLALKAYQHEVQLNFRQDHPGAEENIITLGKPVPAELLREI